MLVCFKGLSSGFPTRHQITVEALCLAKGSARRFSKPKAVLFRVRA